MNTNYNVKQPAFTARLVIDNIKLNPEKIQAVSQQFSEKTLHYLDDTLKISKEMVKRDNGTSFSIYDFSNNKTSAGFALDKQVFRRWFEETSVDDVVQSLVRVFKYARVKEMKDRQCMSLQLHIDKLQKTADLNRKKYELTQNPVFKTLYENNDMRMKALETQLKRNIERIDELGDKIKDNPIDKIIYWWDNY